MSERVAVDPTIAQRVQEFLTEATSGPERGGISGELVVGDVKVDVAASRDWGVLFTRELPCGSVVTEKLNMPDLSLTSAGEAIGRLARAA